MDWRDKPMVYFQGQAGRARSGKARRTPALVIAIAALLAIAACSGSHGPAAKGGSTMKGSVGSVPEPAKGKQYIGTITYALAPNSVPIWIFPLNSSFSASTYNVQPFQWQMWRPLYWTQNGAVPEIVPSMSLARRPVWSDNNKTLTITMNSAYKWSDGQPVTSRDVLFDLDLMKAAIKENPANWVYYTPGYFPDNLVSATTPNPSTLVLKLSKPVNPTWFEEDILATAGTPFPSHAWAKASVDGPILDFTNPANAKKIYDYLPSRPVSSPRTRATRLWQDVDGPYHLSGLQREHLGPDMKSPTRSTPARRGTHRELQQGYRSPRSPPSSDRCAAATSTWAHDYTASRRSPILSGGLQRLRLPAFGFA